MQPVEFLRETAGYADRPREFDEVIEILDSERRLITPTDSRLSRTLRRKECDIALLSTDPRLSRTVPPNVAHP